MKSQIAGISSVINSVRINTKEYINTPVDYARKGQ